MIKHHNGYVTIICDRCGIKQTEDSKDHNERFFNSGWGLNTNAKKYINQCYRCLGSRSPVKVWNELKPKLSKHPLIKETV